MCRKRELNVQIFPYLRASDAELVRKFHKANTREDVAALLEIPDRLLRSILYYRKDRKNYLEKLIPKRHGGDRRICVPPTNIRILQDKLLRVLSLIYSPKPCVTGFVIGRSIRNNAIPHVKVRHLLSFDLQDFFPTVHFGRIRGILHSNVYGLGTEASTIIAQIVTHHDGHLPQGAPTSPIIANIVCSPFDSDMTALAKKHRCSYSRYADDITLSTTRARFPVDLASYGNNNECSLGAELVNLVTEHGFKIRDGKTRLRSHQRRQQVTGLVVNEFVNLSQPYLRELRALIHCCLNSGLAVAAQKHAEVRKRETGPDSEQWIRSVIVGRLAYVRMIRGEQDHLYQKLLQSASKIPAIKLPTVLPLADRQSQPIRWRSRRPPDWSLWARKYNNSIFRLKCECRASNKEGYGTAFLIDKHRIVTAGHNAIIHPGEKDLRDLSLCDPWVAKYAVSITHAEYALNRNDLAIGTVLFGPESNGLPIRTQNRIPELGEEIMALGYPTIPMQNICFVVHVGRVEAILTNGHGFRYIAVSFASGPGLSGGPLIDAHGYCIGVMTENTYEHSENSGGHSEGPPKKPYGQAILLAHLRDLSPLAPGKN